MPQEKLKQFLTLMSDSLSKKDFESKFGVVLEVVKKAIGVLEQKFQDTINSLTSKIDARLAQIKDGKDGKDGDKGADGKDGQDGKDADPTEVALQASKLAQEAVKPLIPTIEQIEQDLPKLGFKILDAILLLGEDGLQVKDINGLPEALDELRKLKGKTVGGGGFSAISMLQHFIHDEIPVDSGDHLNFTITHSPSPVNSFKLYRSRARQNITEDYTLTGNNLTLTVAFDSTNESLFCDYMV